MNNYRKSLPQFNGKMFLTDGGLETTLIFHKGLHLPHFASFLLLDDPVNCQVLQEYYENYVKIARQAKNGFILESPTFRSNPDWGYKLGYDSKSLHEINTKSINQLQHIKAEYEDEDTPIIVSGCIGPRGDGYVVRDLMTEEEACDYHTAQIQCFKDAGADIVTSYTINYVAEGLGIALAARKVGIPVAIGFTLEIDGHLPSGTSLKEAIEKIDQETGDYPDYYMINCAHPSHFTDQLQAGGTWKNRIMAIRANASCKSHAELDESEHLEAGDKVELAQRYKDLQEILPNLRVVGGCCGTDHTHIAEICKHL